jgi:hypothetical protein
VTNPVLEEAKAVWHRRRATTQEGLAPVREVAQGHAHPAPAPHPQASPQGAADAQPIHSHPRQEPHYVRHRYLSLLCCLLSSHELKQGRRSDSVQGRQGGGMQGRRVGRATVGRAGGVMARNYVVSHIVFTCSISNWRCTSSHVSYFIQMRDACFARLG